MYRPDDLIVTQTENETGNYHRLAEAMRRGCKLLPVKARGCFTKGRVALYVGRGGGEWKLASEHGFS
jgi:hypothetical protein